MLKEHNKEAYRATKEILLNYRECCLVAATGIGKSNIAMELIKEFDLNALIIAPKQSIRDNWSEMPDKYGYQPTISTITYQYFSRHYEELYGFDIYVFDEAHHAGSEVWGAKIKKFREKLDTEFVLGLTADPNRYSDKKILDKKNRNVINSVFHKHAVYGFNQKEAIEHGILPKADYICAIYNIEGLFKRYSEKSMSDELRGRLNYTRTNCEAIETIIRRHIPQKAPTKGIVFVDSINNIDIGVRLARRSFPKEAVHYIHSKLRDVENEETLNMFKKAKSGFIVTVDMLNEGIHIEGINTIIMLRKTQSPSLYTQQIGRGLSAYSKNVTIFDLVRNDTSIKKVLARIDDVKDNNNSSTKNKKEYTIHISDQSIIYDYATDILKVLESIDEYNNSNNWTEDENNIIREWYPILGSKVCTKLQNRTAAACNRQAYILGVASTRFWSKDEDQIIKDHYMEMGKDIITLIPNRSFSAIEQRAKNKFGLRFKYSWSEQEDQILRDKYPFIGGKVSEFLIGRSRKACNLRAMELGIKYLYKEWSKKEDNIIRKFYPLIDDRVAEKLPGRTKSACIDRARVLGVKPSRYWTDKEDEIIKNNYPKYGCAVYKMLNNRSKDACIARAKILGVRVISANRWKSDEDKILKEYYPTIGYRSFNKIKSKTPAQCMERVKKLGLSTKCGTRWTTQEDNIIIENYKELSIDELHNMLPHRTKNAIALRLSRLGVKKSN